MHITYCVHETIHYISHTSALDTEHCKLYSVHCTLMCSLLKGTSEPTVCTLYLLH